MLGALALRLADLEEEFKLLSCIIVLLLFDSAVDHAIKGQEESLIALGGSLVGLVRRFILTLETALVAHLRLIRSIFWLQYDSHIKQLKRALEYFWLATAETCENARNIEDQVRVAALSRPQRILQLVKLLLKHLLIILTRQKIEAVDSKGFNIVTILEDDCADALHGVVPLAVLDMNLAFFGEHWAEVGVQNGDLGESCKAFVISLGLLENLGAPK